VDGKKPLRVVYEQELSDKLSAARRRNAVVELATANTSDIEISEVFLRFVTDKAAEELVNKKRYRRVEAPVGSLLIAPYPFEIEDTVTIGYSRWWKFRRLKLEGIKI